MPFDLKSYLAHYKKKVDALLKEVIEMEPEPAKKVCEAMQYSLMAGGKRLRPILMISSAKALEKDESIVMPAACAIECIHTYSLIHDDLPAMDDDDLRRGKPTCHKAFNEAIAILAGDGLLTLAFEVLSSDWSKAPWDINYIDPMCKIEAINLIARAAGIKGMVGGQCADIETEGKTIEEKTLYYIHSHKTAAMIQVSLEAAALLCNANRRDREALAKFGFNLGLAFQIRDDLLDIEGDEKQIGKPIGSDIKKQKATYPALFGIEGAKKRANELIKDALSYIEHLGDEATPLRAIAQYIIYRDK